MGLEPRHQRLVDKIQHSYIYTVIYVLYTRCLIEGCFDIIVFCDTSRRTCVN